jgi:hypothetical protein
MKFLCPACDRLVPLSHHRTEQGALFVRCPQCGVESAALAETAARGAVPPASVSADPFAIPADRCPRCIASRPPGAQACPGCGLAFEQAHAEVYIPEPALASEWVNLIGQWGDATAHARLLASVAQRGELAALGRLYRLRLAVTPDDAFARKGRDDVLAHASSPASFGAANTAFPERGSERWKLLAAAALVVLLCFLVVALIRQLGASKI